MSIRDRFEPKSDDIMDLIMAYEQLRLNALRLLDFIKAFALEEDGYNYWYAHQNDAQAILRDLGEL